MTTIGVAKLKATLSAVLERVGAGETVLVTDHGRPVARIVPVTPASEEVGARLAAMERAGLVTVGAGRIPNDYWRMVLPTDAMGKSLAAVLADREAGW